MEFIIKIGQFLLSLSLLIVLHELGHFIPAKLFKTRVEKFYLFFDVKFSLFKKKIGGTEYGIGWLPLGGYVKIAGMIDESMDTEAMAEEPKPWEFRSKPAWQRLIIMLGGVFVNFVLALIIFIITAFIYGDKEITTSSLKDGFWIENQLLNDAGLKTGDKVIAVNNKPVTKVSEVSKSIINARTITVERNNTKQTFNLPIDFLGQYSSKKKTKGLFKLRVPFLVGEVSDSSLNKNSDIKIGDIITSINNKELQYFDEFKSELQNLKNQTVSVNILRGNEKIHKTLKVDEKGRFGFRPGKDSKRSQELGYYKVDKYTYTFSESFGAGANKFTGTITDYFSQLKAIGNVETGAYKGVGGFKAIYDQFPSVWSWEYFWWITAFLSIMLGVLNLLPIPALDGGHVMFLLYEMISGRKPSDKFMEYAQMVGFFLLIGLVLFANGNDIFKAIFN